ncbi:MAG: T9SS type A sorting domain-containing protein [Crocinitomicaceae bacterium]|nr:T9SS type A sorting domain-containing protein [Crocinitomicaceae bacterium]
MKNLSIVLFCFITNFGISQEWTTITQAELGTTFFTEDYIEVNRSDNSIWFGDKDKWFHIKEGVLEDEIDTPTLTGASINNITGITIINDTIWASDKVYGLITYDGTSIGVESLSIKRGYNFYIDSDDTLWVATGIESSEPRAFYGYKDGGFRTYNAYDMELYSNHCFDILKDSQDRIWITHWSDASTDEYGSGFSMLDGTNWKVEHEVLTGFPTNNVINVRESSEHGILLTSTIGIFKYNEVTEDFTLYNTSNTNMPTNDIRRFEIDSEGRMWGLFHDTAMAYSYDLVNWEPFYSWTSPILPHRIMDFVIDTADNVWILGVEKIWVYNPEGLTGWLGEGAKKEKETANNLLVYPNPSNGIINLSSADEIVHYSIYNLLGELVLENEVYSKHVQINTDLPKGTYLINVEHRNGVIEKRKLLIQ